MDEQQVNEAIQRKQIEDSLRQDFEGLLSTRAARYLQVKPHPIIQNSHFAAASSECVFLYRDGHFYGCISLTQAVTEALVKFLCLKNSYKPTNNFESNVEKLYKRGFISEEMRELLYRIWKDRDDYHHLNPNVETERQRLEELAKEKLLLKDKIEGEIFAFRIVDGKILPIHPKYWDISDNQIDVFLRLEP